MIRLQDNPPMTLSTAISLDDVNQRWTAAYCKPRQEKALAWDLCRHEVPYFLPMVMRETSSGGRRRRNLYPMFQSYLFFAGDEDDRLTVLKTNRLVRLVEISPAEQPLFRREISSLELVLRTLPGEIKFYPNIVEGQRVQIIGGPMAGTEGTILNAENKVKLWIGVSLMGAGAIVEIHADLVEPIAEQPKQESPTGQIEYHVGGGKFIATSGIRRAARK